ncbi:lysine decarboxylase, partial [Staphylococcus arlettae]
IGNLQQLDVSMDMTEITGLDDLHHPEGIMQETMENLSKHKDYNAFLLVNGTTSGIMSVIQGFASLLGSYIIARNAHKSVFHGLELANGDATLLPMQLSKQTR